MSGFSGVDTAYRHITKTAVPGPLLIVGPAELKWYDLAADHGVEDHVRASGQFYLAAAFADHLESAAGGAGFALLHRCGESFYFLLTCVWRGSNELWEAVHYRDASMSDFAAFDPAYSPLGVVRPTFCVWELGVVDFEARAWSAYLRSQRKATDRKIWRETRFKGAV